MQDSTKIPKIHKIWWCIVMWWTLIHNFNYQVRCMIAREIVAFFNSRRYKNSHQNTPASPNEFFWAANRRLLLASHRWWSQKARQLNTRKTYIVARWSRLKTIANRLVQKNITPSPRHHRTNFNINSINAPSPFQTTPSPQRYHKSNSIAATQKFFVWS